MPTRLEGSCHCGVVSFTVEAYAPVPYLLCTCSICRKVCGTGGAINLGAYSNTLEVKGKEHISVYNARKASGTKDLSRFSSERHFCKECSTMLWNYDPQWPELVHPFASAIDTPLTDPAELPTPQPMNVMMLDFKPDWVRLPEGEKVFFRRYSLNGSLEEWHKRAGAFVE